MKIKSYLIPEYERLYSLCVIAHELSFDRICFGTIQYRLATGKLAPEVNFIKQFNVKIVLW